MPEMTIYVCIECGEETRQEADLLEVVCFNVARHKRRVARPMRPKDEVKP